MLTLRHPITLARLALKKLSRMMTRSASRVSAADEQSRETSRHEFIDYRDLIANANIEELNRKAEEYFAKLSSWDFHLSKPFSSISEAPAHLMNFAVVLQGLDLVPRLNILDFGAGSGWTSRFLTQLGCKTYVLDVSPTALQMARELYERQPPIGDVPPPEFILFDGHRIDLPDASVERILCFDAFHHAPNPEVVLREFARVLVDGGVAGFSEPGPGHSGTPQSQSEMRNWGVIEADVDVQQIWTMAQAAGFSDLKLAAYNIPPFHVTLREYEDLLQGGEAYLRWAEQTRAFLRDVRVFYLRKHGVEPIDSRRLEALRAAIDVTMKQEAKAGTGIPVSVRVANVSSGTWLPSGTSPGGVALGCHLHDANGHVLAVDHLWRDLTSPKRPIAPGESVELSFELPPLPAGEYEVEFDCVADKVAWFAQAGSTPVRVRLSVS